MSALPILAIVVLGLLALAAWFLRRRSSSAAERDPADRLDTVIGWPPSPTRVLGKGEILAYKVLVRALPGHMILAKVPLARFLDVPSRHSYAEWLRRLGSQCADLVVCDMAAEVIAVVSVRSSARQMSERAVKRHQRLAKVLKKAGIAHFDWVDDALPTPERARELLLPGATTAVEAVPTVPGQEAAMPIVDGPRDPPPSTWFDEFNSGPAPLVPDKRAAVVSSAAPGRIPVR